MTPEEKAKELVDKFKGIHLIAIKNTKGDLVSPYKSGYLENACYEYNFKKAALVCVEEILNTCVESMIYYWGEVKQEINKQDG